MSLNLVIILLFSSSLAIAANFPVVEREGRVVGGNAVNDLGEYAWQAYFSYGEVYVCAGVVLTRSYVLTTKHCLQDFATLPQLLEVHAGGIAIGLMGQSRTLSKISLDPNGPLAIATFDVDFDMKASCHAIAVGATKVHNESVLWLSGFGKSPTSINAQLQSVNLTGNLIDCDGYELCTEAYNEDTGSAIGACSWDDGTGLVSIHPDTLNRELVGVVVDSQCMGIPGSTTHYVIPNTYSEWINDVIGV